MDTQQLTYNRNLYWHKVQKFTVALLVLWFSATFGVIFFARELSTFTLFGWPFSFYMAAQGLSIFYVLIVLVYVKRMRHLDQILKNEARDAR